MSVPNSRSLAAATMRVRRSTAPGRSTRWYLPAALAASIVVAFVGVRLAGIGVSREAARGDVRRRLRIYAVTLR